MAKMICVKECYTYNKRFRQGQEFPQNWIKEGYLPNEFFAPEDKAKELIEESKLHRPIQCAGDDPRSNDELKQTLSKYTNISARWTRKEIWSKLREYENGEARTETTKVKK